MKKIRILVVRYGTIGDSIFSIPFYRELKNYYKNECIIDSIYDDNNQFILSNCKYIDNLLSEKIFKTKNIFKAINILRNYDKIYFLRKSSTITIIAFLARIKNRIGLSFKGNKFLTKKIIYDSSKHVIDLYLDVLRQDSIPVNNVNLENIFEDKINYEKDIGNKYICIHPFSRSYLKDWTINKYRELIKYIINKTNYDVVILGSEKDFNDCEKLYDSKKRIYNLAGYTNIEESIYFIQHSECFIGVDSGLIHIAAVLNKKSILIHGSTSLIHWRPRNNKCVVISKNFSCSPCCFTINDDKSKYCKDVPKCIDSITVNDVINALEELIN